MAKKKPCLCSICIQYTHINEDGINMPGLMQTLDIRKRHTQWDGLKEPRQQHAEALITLTTLKLDGVYGREPVASSTGVSPAPQSTSSAHHDSAATPVRSILHHPNSAQLSTSSTASRISIQIVRSNPRSNPNSVHWLSWNLKCLA